MDKQRMDMTLDSASWVWKNDQDGYDNWHEELQRNMPESWDSDSSAEETLLRYVHHLEQRVTAEYGVAGLERHHEMPTWTNRGQIQVITEWLARNMPQVSVRDGVDTPVVALLDVCHTTLANVLPVVQSIVTAMTPKLRAAGLLKRCSCPPHTQQVEGLRTMPGRHHTETCPLRGAWI